MKRTALIVSMPVLSILCGCTVTETGNPPAAPQLDDTLVESAPDPIFTPGVVHLVADPGAVEPPEGEIAVTYLDGTTPTERIAVAADGSFDARVSADDGLIRLQVIGTSQRSAPADLRLNLGANELTPVPSPLPCAVVDRSIAIAPGAMSTIRIDNACSGPITFDIPRLRIGGIGFALDAATAMSVNPGSAATIQVRHTSGSEDEVLFLDVNEPSAERIAITLHVDPGG